jgi:thiamine biosynthesis lipoprotein
MPFATARTEPEPTGPLVEPVETPGMLLRSVTSCMGTLAMISVWCADAAAALGEATEELERLESLWSRFRPTSDVARVNAASGAWVEVSAETAALVATALAMTEATGGAFDITLGSAARPAEVRDNTVRLPPGAWIDLGGIGKGAAVQRVIELFQRRKVRSAIVNLGRSSIGTLGTPPGRARWRVAISRPTPPDEPIRLVEPVETHSWPVLTFGEGYLSTSGDEVPASGHMIDPATGEPSTSGARLATVLCDDGAHAEAWSTALLVLGTRGLPMAAAAGCEAVLRDHAGQLRRTPGLEQKEASCG